MLNIKEALYLSSCSCILQKGATVCTYNRHGVIDLYDVYSKAPGFMKGAELADKVVGKAAATLIVKGGIERVYADTISESALALLEHAGIETEFANRVPFISNRTNTGRCPLETACDGKEEPEAIFPVIEEFIRKSSCHAGN